MELQVSKFDLRGGTRIKKTLRKGSSLLLRYIWLKNGGAHAMARRCGGFAQEYVNWQLAGKVVLRRVAKIANELEISPLALNYSEVAPLLFYAYAKPGEKYSLPWLKHWWEHTVTTLVKEPELRQVILKAKGPYED